MKKVLFIWIFVFLISLFSINASHYAGQFAEEKCDNNINWSLTGGTQINCGNNNAYAEYTSSNAISMLYAPRLMNISSDTNVSCRWVDFNQSALTGGNANLMLSASNSTSDAAGAKYILQVNAGSVDFEHALTGGVYGSLFTQDNTAHNLTVILYGSNFSFAVFVNETQKATGYISGAPQAAFTGARIGNVTGIVALGSYSANGIKSGWKQFLCVNGTSFTSVALPDTTPPEIIYYNLTNENGCESWTADKNTACSTLSVTPSVQFNTSENAWCAIAGGSGSASLNINYTEMTSLRNCTGAAAGEGNITHRCTLVPEDELVYDASYLFISCRDASGNMNRSGTSTSGPLKVSVTGLEAAGRTSIGLGIQNALISGYINYTDVPIYSRSLNNNQVVGTFDRAAEKNSRMWAFNWIGASESHVNMPNLTNVLYTLELANKTSINLTFEVEKLINLTK